jgi:vacuolar-type H+-ATPase subunit E/Vma4
MPEVVGDVEALKNKILEQAREEASKALDRAKRVAERDLVYAREEAEEIKAQQRTEIQPLLEAEKKKIVVAAEMEARKKLLEKKEELVDRIFAEAENRLIELRGSKDYVGIISRSIEEAVTAIDADAIIEFGEKDSDIFTPDAISFIESLVAESLGRKLQLQFQCVGDRISAGVIIKSKDGRIIVDNSFSNRLRRIKEEMRGRVSEMLLQE